MSCKNCKLKPVIKLTTTDISLCKKCFIDYFERKVKKTITDYKLINKNDHIIVAASGGKDSTTVLYLLNKITKQRRDIKVTALAIDEGIHSYRDESLERLKKFCKQYNIELNIYSYKKEFGKPLDEVLKTYKGVPCSICGVFRRYLLNKKSRELGATKLATGHNMDDEAQSIVMNYFRNNLPLAARLGPITGLKSNKNFTKRIKPLYFVTEKEVTSYSYIMGFIDKFSECPYNPDSYRGQVRDMINEFEAKYPGTKNGIITSFIELLPLLKEKYKGAVEIKLCEECGEPCSMDVCKACQYIKSAIKIN